MSKTIALFILCIIGIQFCYSQGLKIGPKEFIWNSDDTIAHRKVNYNPVFFVLGTLSDYSGHFTYVNREKQVDRYFPNEKPLVEFLSRFIQINLNIKVDTYFEKSGHCEMYSDTLSKILNNFYDKNGKLVDSLFKTKEQICSFIAGVYYRNGKKIDTLIYKIQLANSPKHQNCFVFLKQLGCTKIFFEYLRGMPIQYVLYFKPTNELENYLFTIEEENKILNEALDNLYFEIMKGNLTKEELEHELRKSKNEEFIRIKNAFER